MRQPLALRILVVFVGLVLAVPRLQSQQPPPFESRRAEVTRALKSIASLFGADISGPARDAVASLLALAEKPIIDRGGEVLIPVPTVRSFQQDEAALRNRDRVRNRAAVTREVETDLRTKDAAYKNSPRGLATLITLEVHTKLIRAETSGWQVMSLAAPLAEFPNAPGEPFGLFSSPTTKSLPPGPYILWAEDPSDASVKGPRKPVTLGSVTGGQASLAPVSADIAVPKRLR
jgi:hypothetical protein